MKKQFIFLTEVVTVLNEAGEKKLERVKSKGEPRDENGKTASWYEDMGIRPPKDLEQQENEIDDDGFIELKEGEFTYDFIDMIVDVQKIYKVTNADVFGSIIELETGEAIRIEEDVFDVYAMISYIQRNSFERFKESVFSFFGAIKRIFKKENE